MSASSSFIQKTVVKPAKFKIEKVPFVELFNGRVQGVVSSGSDISRVYVSFFEAKTLNFCCSTNNNRPCGGLRGSPCKHLQLLLKEAVAHYGIERVATFLQPSGDLTQIKTERDLLAKQGSATNSAASDVFSRFLSYLTHLEHAPSNLPISTMGWFI